MRFIPSLLRPTLFFAAALLLGYTARTVQTWLQFGPSPVQAQSRGSHSDEPLSFQLNSSVGPATSLTVYNASEHLLYVYQGVTQGNSHVNCSFTLHIGRLGGPIDRQNCAVGNAF